MPAIKSSMVRACFCAAFLSARIKEFFGGLVMDYVKNSNAVFIFSAICVAIGAILMLFVKHGEAPDYVAKCDARKAAKAKA